MIRRFGEILSARFCSVARSQPVAHHVEDPSEHRFTDGHLHGRAGVLHREPPAHAGQGPERDAADRSWGRMRLYLDGQRRTILAPDEVQMSLKRIESKLLMSKTDGGKDLCLCLLGKICP